MNKHTVAGSIKVVGGKARKAVDNFIGDSTGAALGAKDVALGKMEKKFGKLIDND